MKIDQSQTKLKVKVVLSKQNEGWVIEKMADRLCQSLVALGCDATVGNDPDPSADVNQWMSYAFADGCPGTINTMMVTHPDDPFKVGLIKERVNSGAIQLALCMSSHTANELATFGVPRERLWYVLPALDAGVVPRRIRLGITGRIYDDGRKREWMLKRLAGEMSLERFRFEIFGPGWESTGEALRLAGAEVLIDSGTEDWIGDYSRIRSSIPEWDYCLYLGMDEGCLGTLDAVSAGIKTIVTAQGFHNDIPGGITHPFTEYSELKKILENIDHEKAERDGLLTDWTWANYAADHLEIWKAMIRHAGNPVPTLELEAAHVRRRVHYSDTATVGHIASKNLRFYLRVFQPQRIRGGLARIPVLQALRKWLGR